MNALVRHRGLLATLVARELKARYRGSFLGFAWSLVNPLLLLAVYSFVFGAVLGARMKGVDPYAVFLVCGLFPWLWVSSSLLDGVVSLSANAALIRKAVFPVRILPVVSVLSNLVHFGLALPVVVVAILVARYYGYERGDLWALLLPAVVILQLLLLSGMAMALAALNVHFKDTRDLTSNFLTLLFFMAPILYPLAAIPERFQLLIRLNPFTPFTLAYHDIFFYGRAPEPRLWVEMAVYGLLAWLLGSLLFSRLEPSLAEAV